MSSCQYCGTALGIVEKRDHEIDCDHNPENGTQQTLRDSIGD